ncbi:hypothetical protein V8F33_007185 [Rhypophila sp. PSN 637]
MSGVKNLRAMFEQKGDTSPPDRGRSPGIPWTPSDSPRPLSKVRTNFIAIEKDGRIGLQRETSQDSIVSASRKLSGGSSDAPYPTPPAIKQDSDVFGANQATAAPPKMNLKDQPIPESPRTETGGPVTNGTTKNTTESKPQAPSSAGTRLKKLGPEGATTDKQPPSNGSASKGEPSVGHLNGVDHSKDKGKAPNKDSKESKEAEKTQSKSNNTKPTPKPLAPSGTKTAAKPARSPTTAKIPKTPTEMPAKLPAKTPDKAQSKEKAATPRTAGASAKATGTSSIKRPPPLQASPASGAGFVKPKPKSPTRPVDLPARLTTHTAASGSKVNGGSRQSLAPAGGVNTTDTAGRSPSRTSVSTATSGARLNVVKSLKRQNSTINRPRPSIGPPPKQPAKDHPPTKKEKEVDESFLARMTRPTQAFASKTAGKAPASPPRKVAAAPAAKKPATKPESHVAKKTMTLPHRPKAPAAPSSQQAETSAAANIAIRVEEVETAEEAIEIAKSIEDAALPQPETKSDPAPAEEVTKPVEEVTEDAPAVEAASSPLASPPQSPVDQPDVDDDNSHTAAAHETAEPVEPVEPASDDKLTAEVATEEPVPAQESVSHEKVEPAESVVTGGPLH